ncbi:MAG: S41 family peptidase [Steroidobacteraceae bacterium]
MTSLMWPALVALCGVPVVYADLGRNDLGRKDNDTYISRTEAAADLEVLKECIGGNSSYIWSVTFPFAQSIERMQAKLPDKVSVNGLSTQINKLVRLFGDDHAQVIDWAARVPPGYTSFQFGKADKRYFLYSGAPAGFVNADFPFVRSIDGVLIEEWFRVAGDIGQGPLSSAAARFARGVRLMRHINYMRGEMGLPVRPDIALEMVSADGARAIHLKLPVATALDETTKPFNLPAHSRLLDGNIGYLRVAAHRGKEGDELRDSIDRLMREFRNTEALIIDARQSGGGKREILNALFPYFMPPGSPPYVFNVAKVRIPQGDKTFDPLAVFDSPDKRLLYAQNPKNPADEAAAYRQFAVSFQPVWSPPAGKFTDWYFMTQRADPLKRFYSRPVYVLIDWGIGSAGDIFVSAFKDWRDVTLVGTPTMGRSGHGREFLLPHSKLVVNLSTMASFQKTGQLYDTVGIAPDVPMEPVPTDWFGTTDTVLARAKAMAAAAIDANRK